ncbi:hypothetical protein FACS1894179_08080 [Bacteroidia bacterium]|nr:hypothetical protein FACS1894179_08080 [Bacteroidia bacterium]
MTISCFLTNWKIRAFQLIINELRFTRCVSLVTVSAIITHSARHSFASVLKRSGANIAYISESLGHSDLKTTETYLASFEKEERIKNAAFLTNFGED